MKASACVIYRQSILTLSTAQKNRPSVRLTTQKIPRIVAINIKADEEWN